jgi:hypothetical protein
MEVDQSAPLVLGDLGVRQPGDLAELPAEESDRPGDLAAQLQDEAVPESA